MCSNYMLKVEFVALVSLKVLLVSLKEHNKFVKKIVTLTWCSNDMFHYI